MKNKLKILLTAMTTLALIGCGGNKGYDGPDVPDDPVIPPVVETSWKDAEVKLMEQHIFGEIIPYVDFENKTDLVYDSEHNELTLSCANVTEAMVKKYAAAVEKDGYVGGLYDSDYYPGYYYYEKETVNKDGDFRIVSLSFYTEDKDGEYAVSGNFILSAYNLYYYSWDDAGISDMVKDIAPNTNVPALNAKYYDISSDSLYYAFFDTHFFTAYGVTQKAFEDYCNKLLSLDWTITESNEEDELIYMAVSPDEALDMTILCDFEGECFDIALSAHVPLTAWPEDLIEEFFAYNEMEYIPVPTLEGKEEVFSSYIDYNSNAVCVSSSEYFEDEYKALLERAGWINANDAQYTYEEYGYFYDDPTFTVEVQFFDYDGTFSFYLYLAEGGTIIDFDLEAIASEIAYNLLEDETAYEDYYEEYGFYYVGVYYEEYSEMNEVECLEEFFTYYVPDGFEMDGDIEFDDENDCYVMYLYNEDLVAAIEVDAYPEDYEGTTYVSFDIFVYDLEEPQERPDGIASGEVATVDYIVAYNDVIYSYDSTVNVYDSVKLNNDITLYFGGKGTNTASFWSANGTSTMRLYQTDDGSMTVKADDEFVIDSIVIEFGNKNGGVLSYNDQTVASGEEIAINNNSATFTISSSGNKGQIRIESICVTYSAK